MQHITTVDVDREWQKGILGRLLRGWAIAGTALFKLSLSTAAFWFDHSWVGFIVLIIGAAFVTWLLTMRHFLLRYMKSDNQLHTLCHQCRDESAAINGRGDLDNFHERAVQAIASFFRARLGDDTINCAIRLAENRDGHQVYATRARSDGMEPTRKVNSEPIPADMGLACALRQKDNLGVFIIRDIAEAVDSGMWKRTKNDSLPDVRTLMVAPINGWEHGGKVMIGILYVTSRKNPFAPAHTLPAKAIADLLGLVYPIVFIRIAGEHPSEENNAR